MWQIVAKDKGIIRDKQLYVLYIVDCLKERIEEPMHYEYLSIYSM